MLDGRGKRVVVIGLDGATFDLIGPWVTRGVLPNIGKLMKGGTYGRLRSVTPPSTAPAWVSFATGKNPGKHGCFDFVIPDGSLDRLRPVTSDDIRGRTFYEIVEEGGGECALVNLPVSYPPRIKNVVITSLMTPGDSFIFPPSLIDDVAELKEYRISPDPEPAMRGRIGRYIRGVRAIEETRFRCARRIYELKEWDFFFYLISGSDWVQHRRYRQLLSGKCRRGSEAVEAFADFDRYIGWFCDNLRGDSNLFVMSDHGFGIRKYFFWVNSWLRDEGYLSARKEREAAFLPTTQERDRERVTGKLITITLGPHLEGVLNRRVLSRKALGLLKRTLPTVLPLRFAKEVMKVEPRRSAAAALPVWACGIYVNDTGRFRDGTVEPGMEFDRLRHEIKRRLSELKGSDGKPVLEWVAFKEEVYSGEHMEHAPDIVFGARRYRIGGGVALRRFSTGNSNAHDPQGIFIGYGSDIKRNEEVQGLSIMDIAPTVLHMLGLAVEEEMDGRVLSSIFRQGSDVLRRDVIVRKARGGRPPVVKRRAGIVDEDRTKARLRALGYL